MLVPAAREKAALLGAIGRASAENRSLQEREQYDTLGAGGVSLARVPNMDEHLAPPSKRRRCVVVNDARENDDVTLVVVSLLLPPEVWAMTMCHLDYKSVLSCAATSRSMLRDVMPLVTMIHIEKSAEMNALSSMRFRDVRDVNIYSLIRQDPLPLPHDPNYTESIVDRDTAMRAVPFLSRFPKLERVVFRGKKSNGDIPYRPGFKNLGFEDGYIDEDDMDNEVGNTLIDLISASFQCQCFPKDLHLSGLRCLHSYPDTNDGTGISGCKVCQRACRSYPLNQVVNFENEGSSSMMLADSDEFYSKRLYTLDVCLTRSEIESIIEARPGGKALLRSDARFFYLLGRGSRYVISSSDDGSRPLCVVEYSKRELEELGRVIEYSQLTAKNISRKKVTRAILRSFAKDDTHATPPNDRCYLARDSFNHLKDTIGLSICEEDFREVLNLNNLPQIFKAVTSDTSIQAACLDLLYSILVWKGRPAIQQIIDLNMVAELVELLRLENSPRIRLKVSIILGKIASLWTNILMDAGAIPKLIDNLPQILEEGMRETQYQGRCLSLLHVIVDEERFPPIQKIVQFGAITNLVDLLHHNKTTRIRELASKILGSIASTGYFASRTLIDAGAIPKLVENLSSSSKRVFTGSLHALGKIARTSTKCRDAVLIAGATAMPMLLEQITSFVIDQDLLRIFSFTLTTLCRGLLTEPYPESVLIGPCLKRLSYLLLNSDGQILISSCKALLHICDGPIERIGAVSEAGFYVVLLELLNHDLQEVHGPALMVIGRLYARETAQVQSLTNIKAISRLLLLLSSPSMDLQQLSCRIISTIAMRDKTGLNILALVTEGCAVSLCRVLVTSDAASAKFGLKALKKVSERTHLRLETLTALMNDVITLPFLLI